jgi:hypothetical protein
MKCDLDLPKCVYILALGKCWKSILKVKLHLQHDLHVHRAMGTSYSPILACGIVCEKKQIFLKTQNKHVYWLYSNEILDIKALEYKEYFTHIDLWRTLKNSQVIYTIVETKF